MDETDAKALMKLSIDQGNVKEIDERFPTAAMCKSILSFSINCNMPLRDVILWKYPQFDRRKVLLKLQEVIKIYRQKKAEDGLLDFDDLLVFWNLLLDEKSVARLIAKRIKYVLVDEYQDTNYIQDEIIYKIVSQKSQKNVMVVGDDAQSIYAFRGADFQNILNFPQKYKGCKTFKITYNYRSVPEILALANDSIAHNEFQHQKDMQATRKNGVKTFQVNVADDKEQARFIANQILALRSEGFELHEMAILFRAGYHSLNIDMELRAKNIPYEVRAGYAFFEKAHIKDLLCHLRVIENPYDEVSWARIFTIIPGIGSTSGTKIFAAISQSESPLDSILKEGFFSVTMKGARIQNTGKKNLISHINHMAGFGPEDTPSEVILTLIELLKDYVKSKYENWQDRLDDLNQLSIYAQNTPTLQKFLETLTLNRSTIESKTVVAGSPHEEEKPLVLSTIHRAKGLEWRVVLIPMLCEDLFPSSRVAGDDKAYEEERRVFYVAVTRAKDQLYLLSPALVQTFGRYQTYRISQLVSELSPNVYKKSLVKFKSKKERKTPGFKSAIDLI